MSNMWGFDLDMTAVRLMRREDGKWQEVAAEKIEGADIEERLMALVARVDDGVPVDLFLPRDQILYTDVAISSEESARAEIEAALEGATPYPVDDLDLDWEMTGPGSARVAAIALETLDEAVAFAEVRGLKVGGFSSLADTRDFPRMPDFTGHSILTIDEDDENAAAPASAVTFASARVTSKPRPEAGSLTPVAPEAQPVVKVDDDAPIMRISVPTAKPLDPGMPLAAPAVPPRVRTDIAAAVVSKQVASLTPPSVKIRRTSPAAWRVGAVLAVAFLITVGIATLVWQLLPLGPGSSDIPVADETGAGIEAPAPATATPEIEVAEPGASEDAPDMTLPETEIAAPADESVAPLGAAPEAEVALAPEAPDLPQPGAEAEVAVLVAPTSGEAPALAAIAPVAKMPRPGFRVALRSGEGLPFVDLGLPAEPTPRQLASIQVTAPSSVPDPSGEDAEHPGNVTLVSLDRADVSPALVALPEVSALAGADLPERGPAPEALVAPSPEIIADKPEPQPEVFASVEPTVTPDVPLPEVAPPAAPEADVADTLPRPTAFAQALPETAPRARPSAFTRELERRRFGGRTVSELAELRPPARPASAQTEAVAARDAVTEATALAVDTSPNPRRRPEDFDAIVAVAVVQKQAERVTASLDYQTPNTSAAIEAALEEDAEPESDPVPNLSIPSSASVSRQATIPDAIRLNRVNLVGVYGTSVDRRALIRLPSGRFVKVKVGDRVDGGTVAKITDDELIYKKGRRTVLLSVPKG